jgi:hypothetical protein
MKTVITLAAAGVFALSTSAWAGEGHNCGGYQQSVQTEKPTITLATTKATTEQTVSTQITSTGDKPTKPGS